MLLKLNIFEFSGSSLDFSLVLAQVISEVSCHIFQNLILISSQVALNIKGNLTTLVQVLVVHNSTASLY